MSAVKRTLLNWKWWAILPVMVLLLPVVACDLMLAAFVTAGEEADNCRRWLTRTSGRFITPLNRWAQRKQP